VSEKILSEAHHFAEISSQQATAPPTLAKLPPTLFRLQYRSQSMGFKNIVSTSKTAPYDTYSPSSMSALHEALMLLVYLSSTDAMEKGPAAWRTNLVRAGSILRFKGGEQMYMAFTARSMIACLWPLDEHRIGKTRYWSLRKLADSSALLWRPVLDFDDCMVISYSFANQMRIHVDSRGRWPPKSVQVWFRDSGLKEANVLRHAALHGFQGVPQVIIDKILRMELGGSAEGKNAAERTLLCVKLALKCSDLEAAEKLEGHVMPDYSEDSCKPRCLYAPELL
jgi:hypothetical protein